MCIDGELLAEPVDGETSATNSASDRRRDHDASRQPLARTRRRPRAARVRQRAT